MYDFLSAMEDANGADLSGIKPWYTQVPTHLGSSLRERMMYAPGIPRDALVGCGLLTNTFPMIRPRTAQAGTPKLTVRTSYDAAAKTFTLECSQATPATPGQPTKVPALIPIAVGLLGARGVSGKVVDHHSCHAPTALAVSGFTQAL